jgi:hypothetical protein
MPSTKFAAYFLGLLINTSPQHHTKMRNAGSLWLSHATLPRSTPLNAGCKGGSPAKKRGFPKGGGKPAFEKSIKEKYL